MVAATLSHGPVCAPSPCPVKNPGSRPGPKISMHFYKLTGSSSCEPGSIKLQSRTGNNPAAGHLQMCDNGREWKAVCGYPWDANQAKVACRQLGFSDRGNHYKLCFCTIVQM